MTEYGSMSKHSILKYLFMDHIHPVMTHRITGERMSLWDCGVEKWNRVAKNDKDNQRKLMIDLHKNMRKVSDQEYDLLWDTGWVNLDDTEYEGGKWTMERFEINE